MKIVPDAWPDVAVQMDALLSGEKRLVFLHGRGLEDLPHNVHGVEIEDEGVAAFRNRSDAPAWEARVRAVGLWRANGEWLGYRFPDKPCAPATHMVSVFRGRGVVHDEAVPTREMADGRARELALLFPGDRVVVCGALDALRARVARYTPLDVERFPDAVALVGTRV